MPTRLRASLHLLGRRAMSSRSYDDAITCLNSLQSNPAEVKQGNRPPAIRGPRKLQLVREYLARIGYSPEDLNKLNVIHVTGTKGKGSTSAMVDSILRQVNPNWKTGLYTSPHLIAVRERIRINGVPLSEELFTNYFFEVWDKLGENAARSEDATLRPMYFRFLTILAYHVFLSMRVNASILEVGIGGLLDDTNVVPKPVVTGVSSIGYDHMGILGTTLSEIAAQKGGIFKEDVPAYTTERSPEPLASLERQAKLRKVSSFQVVSPSPALSKMPIGLAGQHQIQNATLAVHLSDAFAKRFGEGSIILEDGSLTPDAAFGLANVKWPGRCQKVSDPVQKRLNWFLDGAHTEESLECCVRWFVSREAALSERPDSRIMVFNLTKGRSGPDFLNTILRTLQSQLDDLAPGERAEDFFDHIIFCSNITYEDGGFKKADLLSVGLNQSNDDFLAVQNELAQIWAGLVPSFNKDNIHVVLSIEHAISKAKSIADQNTAQVLVTGSMHLVGGAIEVASLAHSVFGGH